MRTAMRWGAAAFAVGVLATGCASGSDGTDFTGKSAGGASATAPADTPADTTSAAPKESGPKSFAMGHKATISQNGVDILRLTVSTPRTIPGDEFNKAENGRYLAVTVAFESLAAAQDVNPFDFIAVTNDGDRFEPTFGPEIGADLNSATLNTGEKARGSIVFDVPAKGVAGIAYAPADQILGTWKL